MGDYDNDGWLDLLACGQSFATRTLLFRNTGTSFVEVPLPSVPGVYLGTVAWADYDNDGRLDFLVSGATSTFNPPEPITQIWRNTGTGFAESGTPLRAVYFSSAAWGDYNNDGRIDLVIAGRATNGSGYTELWLNNAWQSNTPPAAPTGLEAVVTNGVVTFRWNASTDAQTPSAGLTYNLRVGTTPGGADLVSAMAAPNGWRRLPERGNADKKLSRTISGLPIGRPLYASVQAIDTSFTGSPFSSERVIAFTTVATPPNGTVVPGDSNGDGVLNEPELQAVLASYWPSSPWLLMTNLAGLGTTNVTFAASNVTATSFTVEATTNFVDWQILGPALPRYLFVDTNAASAPQQYYRLRWP